MSEIELRASSLPLAFRCGGSVHFWGLRVDLVSEAGDLGTAVHEGLRPLVERGEVDWHGAPALAKRFNVDEQEMRMLIGLAVPLWRQFEGLFPDPVTEHEFSERITSNPPIRLTGHADVLACDQVAQRVVMLDWKTGRRDSDYSEQALGYCALALLRDPVAVEATCTLVWIRDGEAENYTMKREDLPAWLDRLRQLVHWDGIYRVGEHCTYCKRRHSCEGRHALVQGRIAELVGAPTVRLDLMEPSELVQLLERADLAAEVGKGVRAAIKDEVRARGDVVAGGKRLTIATEERRALDTRKAWHVIDVLLTPEQMEASVEISLAEVERFVAKNAPARKGAAAVRQLRQALEDVGAIQTHSIEKLTTRRHAE